MAYPLYRMAVFSTRAGRYTQRQAVPHMNIVIRSDPKDDRDTMAAKLQNEFPEICKGIIGPMQNVPDYFDGYDQNLHGFEFLRAVLSYIAEGNAVQAERVQDFVRRWMNTNTEAFAMVVAGHALEDLFTEEDIDEYGHLFLGDALVQVKRLRDQADRATWAEAHQQTVRYQQQHQHMNQAHRNLILSQAPTYGSFPHDSLASQNQRAISNPENVQTHPPPGQIRRIPPPQDQFPTPQIRYPQQRLTPSTEALERIHPGSTIRGDFQSDPTNHVVDSYRSPSLMNYNVAVPSRGVPGPFSYGPFARVPLSKRQRTFNGDQPRGKKNPTKKSSDDARRGNGTSVRRQSSNHGFSGQFRASQTAQSPQPIQSPLGQMETPSNTYISASGPPWDNQHQRNVSKRPPAGTQNVLAPSLAANCCQQSSTGTRPNPPASYASIPLSGQSEDTMGPNAPPITVTDPLILQCSKQQSSSIMGQHPNEILPFTPGQAQPSAMQTLDPLTIGQQIRNIQTNFQDPNTSASRSYGHSSMSYNTQSQQPQQSLQNFTGQASPRKNPEYAIGSRIWVGGVPSDFSKAAARAMLEPCRGLVDVSEPKMSQPTCSNYSKWLTFVFVEFQNQDYAEEALDRIPKSHFACLPEGKYLSAKWPYKRQYPSPIQYRQRDISNEEQDTPYTSPTKARKVSSLEGPKTRPGGGEVTHSRKKSGIIQSQEASVANTTNSTWTIVSDIRGPEPVVHTYPNLGLSAGEAASKSDPSIISDQGVKTDLTVYAVQPLVQNKDSVKTRDECASQEGAGRDTATRQISNTGDSATDSAPKKVSSQDFKGHRKTPSRHDSQDAPKIAPKQPDKKINHFRASNKLKKTVEGQSLRGPPALENAKPTAEKKAREVVGKDVGKVACSNHKSDGVKESGSEIEASNSFAKHSPALITATSEVQLLTNPSILPILSEKPIQSSSVPKPTIPGTQPLIGPSIPTLLQEKPYHVEKSTSVEQISAPAAIWTSGSNVETCEPQPLELTQKSSKSIGSDLPTDQDQKLRSEEMARISSVSTQAYKGGASFEASSTAPTLVFYTECSNSIADELRLNLVELEGESPKKERQSVGVDSDQLRSILQADFEADVATPARRETFKDSSVQADLPTIKQPSTAAPVASGFPQVPLHAEVASLQTLSVPKTLAVLEPEQEREHAKPLPQNVSNVGMKPVLAEEAPMMTADKMSGPPSVAPTSPHGPSSSPDYGNSRSPQRKHAPVIPPRSSSLPLGPAPIHTRHKKKPKNFVPVDKGGNTSTSQAPVAHLEQQENDQVLDRETIMAPNQHAKSIKATKTDQKQSAKPKDEKPDQYEHTPSLTAEPVSHTPSLDRSKCLPKPENPYDMATDMPPKSPTQGQRNIAAALRDSGYLSSLNSSNDGHLVATDMDLVRLEELYEELESSEGQVEGDEDGKQLIGHLSTSRLNLADLSPPRTPTKKTVDRNKTVEDISAVRSLEKKIEQIAAEKTFFKAMRGERLVGTSSEDHKIKTAKNLLDTSPSHNALKMNSKEWTKMATQFIEEDSPTHFSPPVTPTQKSKTTDTHRFSSSPVTPMRNQDRARTVSPGVRDSQGPKFKLVKLKPNEDALKAFAENVAELHEDRKSPEPKSFFPKKSNRTSSSSDGVATPPSPQTLGRRTPSQDRKKPFPSPPSLHKSHQSIESLETFFSGIGARSRLALEESRKRNLGRMYMEDAEAYPRLQTYSDQSNPLERDVVGEWTQNSGFKEIEMENEKEEDMNERLQNIIPLHIQDASLQNQTEEKKVAVENTKEEDELELEEEESQIMAPSKALDVVAPANIEDLPVNTLQGHESIIQKDASTHVNDQEAQEVKDGNDKGKDPACEGPQSANDADTQGKELIKSKDEVAGDLGSNQENINSDKQGPPSSEPKASDPKSNNDSHTRDTHKDVEYPILKHSSGNSVPEGKDKAAPHEGYAAAAKKTIAQNGEKQGEKRLEKKGKKRGRRQGRNDPWAITTGEDAWGDAAQGDAKRKLSK